jgi:hypothetical protein
LLYSYFGSIFGNLIGLNKSVFPQPIYLISALLQKLKFPISVKFKSHYTLISDLDRQPILNSYIPM